jgi:hypothetical protein
MGPESLVGASNSLCCQIISGIEGTQFGSRNVVGLGAALARGSIGGADPQPLPERPRFAQIR